MHKLVLLIALIYPDLFQIKRVHKYSTDTRATERNESMLLFIVYYNIMISVFTKSTCIIVHGGTVFHVQCFHR